MKCFLEGYNVTVIAYGQTGSGKTFTMGTADIQCQSQEQDAEQQGLIPRFVTDLYNNMERDDQNLQSMSFKVKISFLEIYGEDVFDLIGASVTASCSGNVASAGVLSPLPAFARAERTSLTIREDENGKVFVQGQNEVEALNAEKVLELLSIGSRNRITGSTAMNAGSSRSHAVFTVTLEQQAKTRDYPSSEGSNAITTISKLTFVDLAGSERIKRTGAEGQRLKEGIQINSGLFNLGAERGLFRSSSLSSE